MSNNNNGLWLALVGLGVIADRPNIPVVPAGVGAFWIATDTGNVSAWNGTAWTNVASSTAPVAFAALPATPYAGQTAVINNASSHVLGADAAGGGANLVQVFYTGSKWIIGNGATPS